MTPPYSPITKEDLTTSITPHPHPAIVHNPGCVLTWFACSLSFHYTHKWAMGFSVLENSARKLARKIGCMHCIWPWFKMVRYSNFWVWPDEYKCYNYEDTASNKCYVKALWTPVNVRIVNLQRFFSILCLSLSQGAKIKGWFEMELKCAHLLAKLQSLPTLLALFTSIFPECAPFQYLYLLLRAKTVQTKVITLVVGNKFHWNQYVKVNVLRIML